MNKIKDSTDMDLEIARSPVVQCPVNGWQLKRYCESGPWRRGWEVPCPFYKGEKELIDLKGEKFTVVHCEAEQIRKSKIGDERR